MITQRKAKNLYLKYCIDNYKSVIKYIDDKIRSTVNNGYILYDFKWYDYEGQLCPEDISTLSFGEKRAYEHKFLTMIRKLKIYYECLGFYVELFDKYESNKFELTHIEISWYKIKNEKSNYDKLLEDIKYDVEHIKNNTRKY